MNEILRDMPLFVEVAKQKSFTKAADILDIPLSSVSRRIIAMEEALSIPLFYRSSRKVELTEAGKKFYERCSDIVAEAETACDELSKDMKSASGRLRVSIFTDLYYVYLQGFLSSFARQFPDINMTIQLSERWVDLHTEPFDVDIRVGVLPDSDLIVRRLASLEMALYISPKLLEFYPAPKTPADLANLPCIGFSPGSANWEMTNDQGETASIPVAGNYVVNSAGVGREMVLAGLGIFWLPLPVSGEYEKRGELVRILPGWTLPGAGIKMVTATRQPPYRVRLFTEQLVEYFSRKSPGVQVDRKGKKQG